MIKASITCAIRGISVSEYACLMLWSKLPRMQFLHV
jgi:hypothetical protein